jgi:hypothetical protein
MTRALAAALALLFIGTALLADEIKGTFKSATDDKITITVDGADKTYNLAKDPLVVTDDNKAKAVKGGLAKMKAGTAVTVITDKKDDKDVVVTVKVKAAKKKN